MKKFLVSLLATCLLVGTVTASQAFTWHVKTEDGVGWTGPGVTSDTGAYTNRLIAAFGDQVVSTPSVLSYGITLTTSNVPPPSSDTLTNIPTTFTFDVTNNVGGVDVGLLHHIQVNGHVRKDATDPVGTMSETSGPPVVISNSTAAFVLNLDPTAIIDLDNPGAVLLPGTVINPAGRESRLLLTKVNGIDINLYVEFLNALTPPDQVISALSVGGFITDVPEPGSLALLVGSGVGGSLFLLRRRRA